MPLKLNVKPGERLFVQGGTIEIAAEGTIGIVIDGQVVVMRETDYLAQAAAVTPRRQIVWALQEAYLNGDSKSYNDALTAAMSQAGTALKGEAATVWADLSVKIMENHIYKALIAARKLVLLEEGFADWPALVASPDVAAESDAA